jgi:predicted ferric reductase
MLTEETLLEIARFIGIIGLLLFVLSGVGGALMASRTVQLINVRWLRGKLFNYHRLGTLIGFALMFLHPIPMLFAPKATGEMSLFHVLVPFTAPKQTFFTGLGVIAFYVLLIVAISSILIKYMKREWWRVLHYGTYIVIFLGLIHGLFISGEFIEEEELIDFEEPEKIILLILLIIALSIPTWRLFLAKRFLAKKETV